MNLTHPTLFHKGKKGELRSWTVSVDGSRVIVDYGVVGGKLTTHSYEAQPKNVGRANATTAEQQADQEAAALHLHKLSRKYSLTQEGAEAVLDQLPMLAKKWSDKHAKFPAMVQRKYDGNRMTARRVNGEWVFMSRQGREFSMPHIAEALDEFTIEGEVVLDGEIYCHGKTLQQIVSLVKRYRAESVALQYVVYDYICLDDTRDHTNMQRQALLQDAIPFNDTGPSSGADSPVVVAQTFMVTSYDEAIQLQGRFLGEGYEGAILRNLDGLYRFAYRSNDLLKLKVWEDAEFQVADVVDKKLPGLAIFVCWKHGCEGEPVVLKGPNKNAFEVVKKGGHESRRVDFQNREYLLGQALNVRYAFLTKDGVPFHPVATAIRPEWDR
jgi:DNA ligase-1